MTDKHLPPIVAVAFLSLAFCCLAAANEPQRQQQSRNGHFVLAWASDVEPLSINRMHGWTIRLTNVQGEPVDDADIRISGGMPVHNHGLPSSPRVIEVLGDGRYRVGGMRFHMLGEWELVFEIDVAERRDVVVVPLNVRQ